MVEALRLQGGPSFLYSEYKGRVLFSDPRYRTPTGRVDPVGFFIKEEFYHESIEGESSAMPQVRDIVNDSVGAKLSDQERELLSLLQSWHDRYIDSVCKHVEAQCMTTVEEVDAYIEATWRQTLVSWYNLIGTLETHDWKYEVLCDSRDPGWYVDKDDCLWLRY